MQVTPLSHKNWESAHGDGVVGGIVPGGKLVSKKIQLGLNEISSIAISPSCPSPTTPSIKIWNTIKLFHSMFSNSLREFRIDFTKVKIGNFKQYFIDTATIP